MTASSCIYEDRRQAIRVELDHFFSDQGADRDQTFVNRIKREVISELFQKLLQAQEERKHNFAMELQNFGIGQQDIHSESAQSDTPVQSQIPVIPPGNLQSGTDATVVGTSRFGETLPQGQRPNLPIRVGSAFTGPKTAVTNTSPTLGTPRLSPIQVAALQTAPINMEPTFSFPTSHLPPGLLLSSDLSKVLQPKWDGHLLGWTRFLKDWELYWEHRLAENPTLANSQVMVFLECLSGPELLSAKEILKRKGD